MVQGGDPKSKTAIVGQELGNGDLGYKVEAELRDSLFHFKGVLAAARDDNPQKASSSCQFYLVQGKTFTDEELNMIEQQRLNGRKIPAWQREVYKKTGGAPFLDQRKEAFQQAGETGRLFRDRPGSVWCRSASLLVYFGANLPT